MTMQDTTTQVRVAVRFFAAAKAAAGRDEQQFAVDAGTTLEGLLEKVERSLPDAGAGQGRQVIARCSVLRNGQSGPASDTELADGDTVDLLPPFAGG